MKMMKRITINLERKKLPLEVHKVSEFGKYLGLMFHSSSTKPLLFSFASDKKHPIHSFFVFFNFLAVWLDEDFNVVDFREVGPFIPSVVGKKPFRHLVEIPIHRRYSDLIAFFRRGKRERFK